jgi:hypothetical protein
MTHRRDGVGPEPPSISPPGGGASRIEKNRREILPFIFGAGPWVFPADSSLNYAFKSDSSWINNSDSIHVVRAGVLIDFLPINFHN